ncbi:hypothetical protein AWV80_31585 [Cupriavidus sp. UYMU48A]|nr:hypothetical protein AWV80_31585 [Cupriavidus sp. UYMU48A]
MIAATVLLLGASWAASTGSPEPAMISIISVSGLQVAAKSWIVIRKIGWEAISTWRTVNRSDLMKVCNFAGPMLLVSLLSSSGAWVLGQMILNGPGGPAAFARYAIGLQWFSLGLFLPAILSDVVLPRIIRASKEGFSAKELTKTSAGAAVLMASLISIGAISFGALIPRLYGGHYANDRWLIAAYLAAAIILAPANTIGNAIVANNGQRVWLALTCLWMTVLIVAASSTTQLMAWTGAISQAAAAAALVTGAAMVARNRGLI